jgi:hypothetical protein
MNLVLGFAYKEELMLLAHKATQRIGLQWAAFISQNTVRVNLV